MKIFTILGQVLDETLSKLGEAVDKTWKENNSRIHVEPKKKVYNESNDTTTKYVKYTKNGKTVEEITVNGRKVDPDSDEGKRVKEQFKKSEQKSEEAMSKGFEAMDKSFEVMDKIMDKTFDNMDKMFD